LPNNALNQLSAFASLLFTTPFCDINCNKPELKRFVVEAIEFNPNDVIMLKLRVDVGACCLALRTSPFGFFTSYV
jgi:hypothetical protein